MRQFIDMENGTSRSIVNLLTKKIDAFMLAADDI